MASKASASFYPSKRVLDRFETVRQRAERLVEIADEEDRLRARLDELWSEKTMLIAHLADDARAATETEVREMLTRTPAKL